MRNCDLINGLFVDLWHANATGVYSGIQNSENAGGADLMEENFHRGIAQTNELGIVTFETKFPGMNSLYSLACSSGGFLAPFYSSRLKCTVLSGGWERHPVLLQLNPLQPPHFRALVCDACIICMFLCPW